MFVVVVVFQAYRQQPLEPKTHEKMQIVCKFVHKRCSKCPPFAWTRLEMLSPLVNCSVDNVPLEIGP